MKVAKCRKTGTLYFNSREQECPECKTFHLDNAVIYVEAQLVELDDIEWAAIYYSVAGEMSKSLRIAFQEDADALQQRAFEKLHPLIQRMSLPSPYKLREELREASPKGPTGAPYCGHQPEPGSPWKRCGKPPLHQGDHMYPSGK